MKNFEEIMSERKNRIEARKDELIRRSLLSEEFLEMIQKNKRPFDLLMSYYQCAVMEIETKFRVLNQEYSLEYDKNPIEGIKTRIKSYDSIVRKIRRKNIPMSLTAIEENIKDIAGVRVICSFPEDIYELAEAKKLGIENESVDVDEPVVNREMLGAEVILYFDEQGKTLAVRLSPENQTQVGEKVSLYFDMEKAHVFDPETEENIFVS